MGSKQATGLEPGTEYYVIGAMQNAAGIGYSGKATLFKTKGGDNSGIDDIILLAPDTFYFNNKGIPLGDNYIEFQVSPSTADVEIEISSWYMRGFGDVGDTPTARIEEDDNGVTRVYLTSGNNPHYAIRRSTLTIRHKTNASITKTISLVQNGFVGPNPDHLQDDIVLVF